MLYRIIISLSCLTSFSLLAEELTAQQYSIQAQFYSSDAVKALPRLNALTKQDNEYNKILFKLNDFPKNQEIIFEIKRLASNNPKVYVPKFSFIIQDDGTMKIKDSDQIIQTIISSSHGFLPGERVYYRFRTADGMIKKEISGIPTPAEVKDENYQTIIKADLVSVNPTVYKIFLPGLTEGEQYDLKSTSLGETLKAKPKYSKNKPFHLTPGGKNNKKGGDAILEITRKSGKVHAILLPWGSSLNGYFYGNKVYSPKPN